MQKLSFNLVIHWIHVCSFFMSGILLSGGSIVKSAEVKNQRTGHCSDQAVIMVINGVTHDHTRMQLYAKALAKSGLHQQAGSSYLNHPKRIRTLEGKMDNNHVTLLIDFPTECAALDFWNSPTYQHDIKPLRQGAGNYTIELYKSFVDRN